MARTTKRTIIIIATTRLRLTIVAVWLGGFVWFYGRSDGKAELGNRERFDDLVRLEQGAFGFVDRTESCRM